MTIAEINQKIKDLKAEKERLEDEIGDIEEEIHQLEDEVENINVQGLQPFAESFKDITITKTDDEISLIYDYECLGKVGLKNYFIINYDDFGPHTQTLLMDKKIITQDELQAR